mmetsp:Transcript_113869/g.226600  ORF Transcript_113869/g.226600 Transcript_113869/m.226600 type:complete len:91 (-) Transcript_113869:111-383(-)
MLHLETDSSSQPGSQPAATAGVSVITSHGTTALLLCRSLFNLTESGFFRILRCTSCAASTPLSRIFLFLGIELTAILQSAELGYLRGSGR